MHTLAFTLPSMAVVSPTDKSVLVRGAAPPTYLDEHIYTKISKLICNAAKLYSISTC